MNMISTTATIILCSIYLSTIHAFAPSFVKLPNLKIQQHQRSSSSNTLRMVAVDTSDIKNGMTIELDNEPFKVINFSVMKQARGAAKMTIKFKNLIKGTTIENTYRSGEKFETALIEKKAVQFTYADENDNHYFMDSETFEEIFASSVVMKDVKKWLAEGSECKLVYFKDKVIECIAPSPQTYEVTETEPNVKGNTSGAHSKPALLDCGATVTVPGFVVMGDKVKVDTQKGEYLERA